MPGAGVPMRLEEHEDPVKIAAARRFECRANLGRMMSVIINQHNLIDNSLDFETPAHPGKLLEPGANQVRRNVQVERYSRGCGGVAHIVDSRRAIQMKFSKVVAAVSQPERAFESLELDFTNHEIGLV